MAVRPESIPYLIHTMSLDGKVVLITGASDGIGKTAALDFAKRGANLTLVGRSRSKVEAAVADIKEQSGNEHITALIGDLSYLKEVKRVANEFAATHDRLDLLVNNARATFPKAVMGPDGYELTFALNVLASFVLTTTLLDLIRSTPNARIITTGSASQSGVKIDIEKTPFDVDKPGPAAYSTSKLGALVFAHELQNHLEGCTATSNSFEPGYAKSQFGSFGSFGKSQGWLFDMLYKVESAFSNPDDAGADPLIWLATSPDASSLKGKFVKGHHASTPNSQVKDDAFCKKFWTRLEELSEQALSEKGPFSEKTTPTEKTTTPTDEE